MRINEYIPINGKYFNKGIKEDQFYPVALRRPRLTLKHLNKLRKMRELHRLEQLKRDASIPEIYKTPENPKDKQKKADK